MKDRFFLDTNVLVYTFDGREPEKRDAAQQLLSHALAEGAGVISFQVVQEFLNVATRKFEKPMSAREAHLYLVEILARLWEVFPSTDLYGLGLTLAERYGYSFYDSLIIASALSTECPILYSEDLQHGQTIDGTVIVDPFRDIR